MGNCADGGQSRVHSRPQSKGRTTRLVARNARRFSQSSIQRWYFLPIIVYGAWSPYFSKRRMAEGKLESMIKVLFVFGTRPEAIKLCPVLLHLRSRPSEFETRVCVTAQHRGMLDQVLAAFEVRPDHDLDLMLPGQTLFQSTSRILAALESVLKSQQPDIVLVQGDTTTTLCGALGAFYARIPIGHVEAGLRTGDMSQPFPEEMNRVLAGRLADLHFASTSGAACNLLREGVEQC